MTFGFTYSSCAWRKTTAFMVFLAPQYKDERCKKHHSKNNERRKKMTTQELEQYKEKLNAEYVLRSLFSSAKHLQKGDFYSLEDILNLFSPRIKQISTQ